MDGKKDAFMKRLLSAFRVEADEHIKNMTAGIIELEKNLPPQVKAEIVETVFREAHSLKGAARAVNRTDMESISGSLESVFSGLKQGGVILASPVFDTLHRAIDMLASTALSPPEEGAQQGGVADMEQALAKIARGESGEEKEPRGVHPTPRDSASPPVPEVSLPQTEPPAVEPVQPVPTRKQPSSDTVRIPLEKMEALLRQSEEMLSLKLMADRHMEDILDLSQFFELWHSEIPHDCRKALESKLAALGRAAERDRHATGLLVDNLLDDVKSILMLPLSTLFETFPKLLRDLSRDQDKDVELAISGAEIEIDRRIMEEMRIVFIHLLRNTIDHGIEKPGERIRNNKPPRGIIRIDVARSEGNRVDIHLSDDGRGIDLAALKETSVRLGIVSPEVSGKMADGELLSLAFRSGVSTSPIITDISGRGLGLAIVREKVEKLGGTVSIETRRHEGASIRMTLPLTLATFRGVLVTAAEHTFVIPTANMERTVRVRREEIGTVENRDTLSVEGVAVPLVKLAEILELPGKSEEPAVITVLVLESQGKRTGFSVDEILNEQEVLIKNLALPLSRVRNIAAATILGSGRAVPVLNVSDLMKSAANAAVHPAKPRATAARAEAAKKSILVVEDSITSRTLLKNILETSGYRVVTAVDGIDALTRLKTEQFDAVVSDVDMPRMNGFNLTEKIRADQKLAELPVVLVTALGSREDRERGIDVGANGYIVKSGFDQGNLLETMRRLV